MRAAAAALAGALLLAGCMEDEPRFGGKRLPAKPIAGPEGRFHPSAVRGYHFFNEPYGQRREVHFVATGPRRTHERQARECVRHHLERDVEAPFCYAYPTERAFRAVRFKPANGQTGKNCWGARAQKPADSPLGSSVPNPDNIGEEGCPDLPS